MGRIRRHGYYLEWFIGDHVPRHIHVYDSKGSFIGRLDLDRMAGIEGWMPDKKLIKLIEELRREGRL
jgi:hypothetical protein